jgi:Spy/CpxP family protein refolding chaperone
MNRIALITLAAAFLALPMAIAAQAPQDAPAAEPAARGWEAARGLGPGMGPGGAWMGEQRGQRGWGARRGPHGRMAGRRGIGRGIGRGPGIGPGMGLGILERDAALRERLGVTDQQLERLRALRTEHQQARIRQQAELRIKRLELAEQLRAAEPDRARIEQLMRETHEMQFARKQAAMDHMFAARDVFTAEQRAEMRRLATERMQQMRERRLERRGPRPAPPPPTVE